MECSRGQVLIFVFRLPFLSFVATEHRRPHRPALTDQQPAIAMAGGRASDLFDNAASKLRYEAYSRLQAAAVAFGEQIEVPEIVCIGGQVRRPPACAAASSPAPPAGTSCCAAPGLPHAALSPARPPCRATASPACSRPSWG